MSEQALTNKDVVNVMQKSFDELKTMLVGLDGRLSRLESHRTGRGSLIDGPSVAQLDRVEVFADK